MNLASLSVCATRKGKVAAMGGDETEERILSAMVLMAPVPPSLLFGGREFLFGSVAQWLEHTTHNR